VHQAYYSFPEGNSPWPSNEKKTYKRYLGCDEGAKVLIKMGFYWDLDEKCIVAINLDFDKAGDSAEEGGITILNSLQKYAFEDGTTSNKTKFNGGGSDSGGGFTKEAMRDQLEKVGLVENMKAWTHIKCTSHNDQPNLHNGILSAYGGGGLDAQNVMQLVHAFSDMQNHLEGKMEIKPLLVPA
jgi:hypothetical protein